MLRAELATVGSRCSEIEPQLTVSQQQCSEMEVQLALSQQQLALCQQERTEREEQVNSHNRIP